jgi:putative transposase
MGCVISRTADKWFAAIQVELSELPRKVKDSDKTIGLDLGINSAIATSDGAFYKAPKPLKNLESKLKRQHKSVSRKPKGSNNRKKAVTKLSKIHARIANIRNDWNNKVTSKLIDENQVICLEDLNVAGMIKNNLGKSLSDVSLGEICRQFQYKAAIYGREIRFVNRFYPSSKTCSNCGCIKQDLKRGDEIYNCQDCGFVVDRDLNAAINIRNCAVVTNEVIVANKIPKDIRESAAKPRKLEETRKFESLIQESLGAAR